MAGRASDPDRARPAVLRRAGDLLATLLGAVLALLVAAIVAAIFAQVFWRYVLNAPLLWPEEVARYSFIWLTFLGLPLLLRQGELIAVETLAERLPARLRAALPTLTGLLTAPLLVVLVWQGYWMMKVVAGQVAPATGIPAAWLYLAAPLGGALSLFYLAERLLGGLRRPASEERRG